MRLLLAEQNTVLNGRIRNMVFCKTTVKMMAYNVTSCLRSKCDAPFFEVFVGCVSL